MIPSQSTSLPKYKNEEVLVVPRTALSEYNLPLQGVIELNEKDLAQLQDLILRRCQFLNRNIVEEDPKWKQVIPYVVYQYDDTYFVMQRSSKAGDQRLASLYTLGIGGHLQACDLEGVESIFDWAARELSEEVCLQGINYSVECVGLLNDDVHAVGQVHLGLVFLLKGDSPNIKIRSEMISGRLCTIKELLEMVNHESDRLESWSAILLQHLVTLQNANSKSIAKAMSSTL